ncbi:DNA repair protein RecO [Patescibacteria group bacterium]
MFIHYRTQGIFLKKEDRGEADQFFTIYTKDFGKLKILGRAIRKIKSKLRSSSELFYLSEIEFIQGKAYKTLTDAVLIEKFLNIRKDLSKLKVAYQIVDITDKLIGKEEKEEKIWDLLTKTFQKLNDCSLPRISCFMAYYYFLWNILSISGYGVKLDDCVLCRAKLKENIKIYFDPQEGGLICNNCFKKIQLGTEINPETIKILRVLLGGDWKIIAKLKIKKSHLKSLKEISDSYLSSILDVFK